MTIRNRVRSAARVAADCAVTTLPTSEEGVTVKWVVLNRTPLGGAGRGGADGDLPVPSRGEGTVPRCRPASRGFARGHRHEWGEGVLLRRHG